MPALDLVANVVVSGILTGLVYGLMALGLSVIFGVVRVVNFAHGEMMTVAMYLAVVLFAQFHLDPLLMLLPLAALMFAVGYVMQTALINPFIGRPEHSQFMLLYALSFGLGAACVGAAGTIIVLIFDVTPSQGPAYTLLAFIIVITGGLGSMPGALLGGVLIGLTEAMAGLFVTPSAKSMFAFGLLVLVLLFRPQGILGKA